ncbi:hypothetical protein Sta7437_0675 [Stanieria cyanosphaera PCC 7437]|uniref:Uncharacterized protein n=1 Tax=Stanieria cyanosphaera (strain ATCC 29371 / PCC 7437) TaxID=111780 RepID=K9XNT3_STAC7|nr:hypothetical protein [Stanieria cyanosphaera]AFZ34270.1 hypothetical protein Sta7437_0675 [Stanieria cyanosphaera PCC 7437]
MFPPRWFAKISSLSIDFWLCLPLLSVAFWIGGELISNQVLSRPFNVVSELEANKKTQINLTVTVQFIQVLIDKNRGLAQVEVKTSDSELKRLEFIFPIANFEQVEALIAKELGLSQADVRSLTRYQIKY